MPRCPVSPPEAGVNSALAPETGLASKALCALVDQSETALSSFLSILSDQKLKASSAWLRSRLLRLPSLPQDPVRHRKGGNRKGPWGFHAGSRALPSGSGFNA